ncbi:MAG: hypothetical protein QG639_1140 [Patescibacteria group bacterium]|jgi:hypothetical protein|nr:hypothetical protein [Patescibacteria group bacterium]
MIAVIEKGSYTLLETKKQTKVLLLDHLAFAWIDAKNIGEILVTSHRKHPADCILATGKYRLYKVTDEPKLTDLIHLELLVGEGKWQGYLLPTGLPDDNNKRNRIIPTSEIITK